MRKTTIFAAALAATALASAHAADQGSHETLARAGQSQLELHVGAGDRAVAFRAGSDGAAVILNRTDRMVEDARLTVSGVEDVVFASWHETALTGERDEMSVVSLDGGATWTRARPIPRTIGTRRGVILPGEFEPALPPALGPSRASTLHIVQFETPSLEPWRARLRALGAEVLQPMSHNAHIVRMPAKIRGLVAAETFVRWVGPFHPAYRVEQTILDELTGDDVAEMPARRYLLHTFLAGTVETPVLADEVRALGGEVVRLVADGRNLDAVLTADQVKRIVTSDHLLWIQPWSAPEADMDIVRDVSGANTLEGVEGYLGTGLNGEVMDVGIDTGHTDFTGRITEHGGPAGGGSHGTSVFGIVFGDGSVDGRGRGLNPLGNGYYANSGVGNRIAHTLELLEPAWEAVFQTNSWGDARNLEYNATSAEMDDIVMQADLIIFQSQSNSGNEMSRPQAWAKNVMSVGGFNHFDTADTSDDRHGGNTGSTGPADDGRIKPDLSHFYDDTYTTTNGDQYTEFGGTSGATPVTAGISGIFFQMWYDNIFNSNPVGATIFEARPHAATMKALMINTAIQYPFTGQMADLRRVRQGWGVANAGNAYDRGARIRVIDESSPLVTSDSDTYFAVVPAGQDELKVTMVYTDPPGNPAATVARINDLTLRVVDPDGVEYWGNAGLMDGVWSTIGGAADTINTVENVFIENPKPGAWNVEVIADEVVEDGHSETPQIDQDYGLVVSGVDVLNDCGALVPAPSDPMAAPTGDNEITVDWTGTATATEYRVLRALGGCSGRFEPLATLPAPATTYVDAAASGGVIYGYKIKAIEDCESGATVCVEAETEGVCFLEADFAGLVATVEAPDPTCGINLTWDPGTSSCGGSLVYNVYRSTDPAFIPAAGDRVASCLTGTTYYDTANLVYATEYHYVVRAEDLGAGPFTGVCGGNEENNIRRVAGLPLGPEMIVFQDDFEDGSLSPWTVDVGGGRSGVGQWIEGDPVGTVVGAEPAQPEDCQSGSGCLFTAQNPGGDPHDEDVDGGSVIAISPVFDGTVHPTLRMKLWRWYYREIDSGQSVWRWKIEGTDDGSSWVILESISDSLDPENEWIEVDFDLDQALSLTSSMQVRVVLRDPVASGNVVEGAVDNLRVFSNGMCSTQAPVGGLLRNDMWSVGESAGLYVPLNPVSDLYEPGFMPGATDPAPSAQPLVFYGWEPAAEILMTKTPAGDIEIH